ncbi:histidinol dehydrogenase [Prochlorococcus marinus]|uniref:Histidinol dehydrogenase n=1 Tax=Prochlorococcus marinus XMU1408 TaxID=2213228 RepID=A0A318R7R6_PROMR|nr:histidinol dehydrogenase [Prochlorococcus marinus]MBW3042663.1 histidinol dehydrogenase [Prochlorococcus marinus str. XMU1408]PYE01358.1 histidinol dehydrogenase [Prochlorococcus marinus XMU1408]
MTQIINKNAVQKNLSKKSIIKIANNIDQAKLELKRITDRTSGNVQDEAIKVVNEILKNVCERGDEALKEYTSRFDGFIAEELQVPSDLILKAWEETPKALQDSLLLAKKRIEKFHRLQIPKNINYKGVHGESLGRRWRPVEKAGIYVPGGRAAYPSTVLMNAIPAYVAGVNQTIMVSPANSKGELNKTVLAAAHITGINKVFRIGGAQAIGALANGTESIPKVDVITGPGNIYVTLAKKNVYGKVGIDSLAGPSEILIIADQSAKLEHVASDMLAQSEHDPLASAILITTNKELSKKLPAELERQLINHPRYEICKKSIIDWGLIVLCDELEACIELSDSFAPEHLELLVTDPQELSKNIRNAGAIFMGSWSPEAVGDYLGGPNHTLPTSGTARFAGALGVETFMKNTSLIDFSQEAFDETKHAIVHLANSEGLHSHAESILIRDSKSC